MSKFQCLVIIIIIGLSLPISHASNDNYPFGARGAGMGYATVTLHDFWALSHNQAGLSRLKNPAAGVYFENRFLVEELSFGAAAFAMPVNNGVVGASFTYFGFELYNEAKIGLAYARDFGERFSAGIQLNYHNTGIGENYGNRGNLTFEGGVIFQLLPHLAIGVHLFNPLRAKIGDFADERIPTILKTGLGYTFSDKVLVIAEIEKSISHSLVFKAGIEYKITEHLYVRAGIGTNPTTNSFGFGLHLGNIHIDLATNYHYVLGYSPQIGFIYQFK